MPAIAERQKNNRRGRRSSEEAARNRQRIIDASLSCFARLGYKNTSNEIIAREAGLSAGAIYNHFTSKSELYVSAFEQAETYIANILSEAAIHKDCARDSIEAFFNRAEALYENNPDAARLLSQVSVEIFHNTELAMPLAEKVKGGVENLLKQIIGNGQALGEIDKTVNPDSLVELHINAQLGIAQVSLFYGGDYYAKAMRNLRENMLQLIFGSATKKNTGKQ